MKSFKCFIDNCPNDPEHICKCIPEHTIFCSSHARNHMIKKFDKPHEWIDLYFEPDPESRLLVIKKINELKKEIRLRLDMLVSQYRELLAAIESSLGIAIEKYYKIDAECNDIICFAAQERILNMPTENKIEEPLKLDPEKCNKIIKYWAIPEIESEIDQIKGWIVKLYENLEVNPFKESDESTVNSEEILFIRNNSTEFNTLNLLSMQASKKILDFSNNNKNMPQAHSRPGASGKSSGMSSILIPHDLSIFFNGIIIKNNGKYNAFEAWTFILDKDKNMKILEPGTQSNSPAITYYKNNAYVLGGKNNCVAEKYDFKMNTWKSLAPLPQNCFCASHSALFDDTILITAKCLNQLMSYNVKQNSYTIIQNLNLNSSLNKSILSYDKRVYVLEFGGSIYQSEINGISKWELVGNNQFSNYIILSYSVAFKGNIYFICGNNQLLEFDLKTNILKCVNFN